MLSLDKSSVDKLLLQLEEGQFIDSRYQFVKDNDELILLGTGGFSYVYEMYDSLEPEKHYAAKIIGLGIKSVAEEYILETTRIQYLLSEQSENILRVIDLWTMKLHLDNKGDILGITGVNQEGYDEADGIRLDIILMEKLENVLRKDKYGNVNLLREELKTEEGVICFAENIGRALFTVHNNGFLHRDIKLENIFWDPMLEQYKLGDFGIARYVGKGDAETMVFTDGYGAPEIECQLAESYNLTADIYSFGITLFLLLNELKFPASDRYQANIVQYTKDFIVPAPINSSVEFAQIIRKMCSYYIKDRYQSVEEVLMDIGRVDGSYTDKGFIEYEDSETVTFQEGDDAQTETYRESNTNEKNEGLEDLPWWCKAESELSREERKKKIELKNKSYAYSSVWNVLITALLVFLLLKSFLPEAPYSGRWEFWVLPIAVIVESFLQSVKEFHVEFGVLTLGIAFFSMYYLGINLSQIVAVVTVLMGIPAFTAGVSIGMGLWIIQMLTGIFGFFDICYKWDLGWIILICLAAVIESYVILRADCNKANIFETLIIIWIMDKIWYLMIIAGILLIILGYFEVIVIPEIVKQIHLVRTGIGIWMVEVVILWYYGLLEDEGDEINEFLDE